MVGYLSLALVGILGVLIALTLRSLRQMDARLQASLDQQRDAVQRLFDMVLVRVPEPPPEEISERARRSAARVGKEREETALHALHCAAVRLGDAWSSDPSDDNLTMSDLGEIRRHFGAAALIAKGWDPREACQRELLGRDQMGVTDAELATLSRERRERAKRLAAQFGALDAEDIATAFEQDLVRRGVLSLD